MLLINGFEDLVQHNDDFEFIWNSFGREDSNLDLVKVFVGGIDFRVLKLELCARLP